MAYLGAARELGIDNFMLSFVEGADDITQVAEASGNQARLSLKIESQKGMDFVNSGVSFSDYTLIAARDDLMINIGENKAKMLPALEQIILRDPKAIVASRIFAGLETDGFVSMGDLSDLRLMYLFGYRNFMLSDGISQLHFDEAVKAWEDFQDVFSE